MGDNMNRICPVVALILLVHSQILMASSNVSELAEMSLEDLMSINIDDTRGSDLTNAKESRWHLSIGAYSQRLEGYRSGTGDLSDEEVLFRPGEVRTDRNYPVLPTEIE